MGPVFILTTDLIVRATLVGVTQQAFVDGFVFIAIICAAGALAVAAVPASVLRNARPGSH